jgi:protein-arginine kinase
MSYVISNDFVEFTNHNMTNFIVIKLMEKSNNLQKNTLLQSFLMNYAMMATDQFGFIVLSKVIENVDIAIIFPLCFQLLNDERV